MAGARQAWRGEAVDLVALESPVAGLGKLVVRGLDTGAEGAEVFIGVDEGAEEGKGIVSALNVYPYASASCFRCSPRKGALLKGALLARSSVALSPRRGPESCTDAGKPDRTFHAADVGA